MNIMKYIRLLRRLTIFFVVGGMLVACGGGEASQNAAAGTGVNGAGSVADTVADGAGGTTSVAVDRTDAPIGGGMTLIQDFSEFDYVGAFRVPLTRNGDSEFSYGGSALAYNAANNSLFIVGHASDQSVAEIAIPANIVDSADIASLATATMLQSFTSVLPRIPVLGPMSGGVRIGDLLVVDGTLVGSVFAYYDANNETVNSHFRMSSLDLNSATIEGLFQVGNIRGGYTGGYMTEVAPEWQDALGAQYVTGQSSLNIITRTSFGPATFGFDPHALGTSRSEAIPYVYYPGNERRLGWGDDAIHNGTTNTTGVVFVPGSRTVLFFGDTGLGRIGYDTPEALGDPYRAGKGYHAVGGHYAFQVWAYDVLDFIDVKNGVKNPWDLDPYAVWNFELPIIEGSHRILGTAFDPATGTLYISQAGADRPGYSRNPLIHVFDLTPD